MIGTVSVFILFAIVVYLIGKYRGIRIGREQMLQLDQRLGQPLLLMDGAVVETQPAAEKKHVGVHLDISAHVSKACYEECERMVQEAHARSEWRLPT